MFWVAAISAGRSLERQQPIFYFRTYQTVFYFHNQPTNHLTNQPTDLKKCTTSGKACNKKIQYFCVTGVREHQPAAV